MGEGSRHAEPFAKHKRAGHHYLRGDRLRGSGESCHPLARFASLSRPREDAERLPAVGFVIACTRRRQCRPPRSLVTSVTAG